MRVASWPCSDRARPCPPWSSLWAALAAFPATAAAAAPHRLWYQLAMDVTGHLSRRCGSSNGQAFHGRPSRNARCSPRRTSRSWNTSSRPVLAGDKASGARMRMGHAGMSQAQDAGGLRLGRPGVGWAPARPTSPQATRSYLRLLTGAVVWVPTVLRAASSHRLGPERRADDVARPSVRGRGTVGGTEMSRSGPLAATWPNGSTKPKADVPRCLLIRLSSRGASPRWHADTRATVATSSRGGSVARTLVQEVF